MSLLWAIVGISDDFEVLRIVLTRDGRLLPIHSDSGAQTLRRGRTRGSAVHAHHAVDCVADAV